MANREVWVVEWKDAEWFTENAFLLLSQAEKCLAKLGETHGRFPRRITRYIPEDTHGQNG